MLVVCSGSPQSAGGQRCWRLGGVLAEELIPWCPFTGKAKLDHRQNLAEKLELLENSRIAELTIRHFELVK